MGRRPIAREGEMSLGIHQGHYEPTIWPLTGAHRHYHRPPLRGGARAARRISSHLMRAGTTWATALPSAPWPPMQWICCMPRGAQPRWTSAKIESGLLAGFPCSSAFEQMNEDIDLSIWRAPMESAMYRAARSNWQLVSKEAVDY